MPGIHLSTTEQKLQAMWESNRFGGFPALKSVAVKALGNDGLRGIKDLCFEIHYPVTFLSGQNGSGKSTLLALAALAYHGMPGHEVPFVKGWSAHPAGSFTYYTFRDFFHRGPGDAVVNDVQISWCFDGRTKNISLVKKSEKWMRYERRPSRPVEYFGIARAVPSTELSVLRNQFGANVSGISRAPLMPETRLIVERVLGRAYPSVEELNGKKFSIRRTGPGGFTSFNMGAGEDSLIALLSRLSQIPRGSLVVIDEVETTLHPAAQRKLAAALVELSFTRQLQIIGSTHSHHILDALPRVARALVIKEGDAHRMVFAPTSMLAMTEISGQQNKELLLICEDQFAAELISSALPTSLRKRIEIHACGSKTELARYARSHLRLSQRARCLIVWDGDVSGAEALSFLSQAKTQVPDAEAKIDDRLDWTCLPGKTCPENWALDVVRTNGLAIAADAFGFDSPQQAQQTLDGCGTDNVHSIPFEIAQQTGLREVEAATRLIGCAVRSAKDPLAQLVAKVCQHLG